MEQGTYDRVEGMSAPTDEWAEALSVEIQQCITRDGEEDPNGSIAELLLKRVAPLAEVRELREERESWHGLYTHTLERAERAESALAEALELLGVMYGWAKYGEESDHWYYSEEQAPGWKADSERVSKLLGFKLKAKP